MRKLPKSGERIGRFELVRKLGRGGMGTVFLARDTFLNIDVALKFLNPWVAQSAVFDRFKREVLLARQISHPGICRMYDIHEEEELFFISMEYVEGSTLLSLIQFSGRLAVWRAVKLVIAICDAIAAAHRLGILHRDLKPGNVIVRGDDQVSVLDFGISKATNMSGLTATGIQMGTLGYVSPEVLRGDTASQLSDVYSVGVILYECVTGRAAFASSDVVAVLQAIDGGHVTPPSVFNDKVPPRLEQIISEAMAPDPTARVPSMQALREKLQALLAELPPEEGEGQRRVPSGSFEIDIAESVSQVFTSSALSDVLQQRRRDSTILFAQIPDIAGYFERCGEEAGLRKVREYSLLLLPLVEEQEGTVLRSVGDSIMASFDSADRGLKTAIEMQYALLTHNAQIAIADEQIHAGIGLHSGEAIYQDSARLGGTASLAQNISSLARPEEILLSRATRDMLGFYHGLTRPRAPAVKGGNGEQVEVFAVDWRQGSEETAGLELQRTVLMRPPSPAEGLASVAGAVAPVAAPDLVAAGLADDQVETVLARPSAVVARAPTSPATPRAQASRGAAPSPRPSALETEALARRSQRPPQALAPGDPDDWGTHATQPSKPFQGVPPPRRRLGLLLLLLALVALATLAAVGVYLAEQEGAGGGLGDQITALVQPSAEGEGAVALAGAVDAAAHTEPPSVAGVDAGGGRADGATAVHAAVPKLPGPTADEVDSGAADAAAGSVAELDTEELEQAGDLDADEGDEEEAEEDDTTSGAGLSAAKVERARRAVLTAAREQGLIAGDVPAIDRELRRMVSLRRSKRYAEAMAAGRRARAELTKVEIDREFVRAKIARFNRLFDRAADAEAAARVEALVPKIFEAFEAGQYEQANRSLNRAFARLGTRHK